MIGGIGMRNLTELLQEIPLDEMTGDDIMKDNRSNAENKDITMYENKGTARVKSRVPAIIAAAAFAAVIGGGVFRYAQNADEPETADTAPAASQTTTAEDSSARDAPVEEGDAQACTSETGQAYDENVALERLAFDNWGRSFENSQSSLTVFDWHVGNIESGFDNLDIRVTGVRASYPYYYIDIAVQTLDGTDIVDDESCTSFSLDYDLTGSSGHFTGGLDNYGSKATGAVRMNLEESGDSIESLDGLTLQINSISYISGDIDEAEGVSHVISGRFIADLPAGEMHYAETTIQPEVTGEWTGDDFFTDSEHIGYTVKQVDIAEGSLAVTLDITEGDTSQLDMVIQSMFYYTKRWTPEEYWGEVEGFDPEADYDFFKAIKTDGTVEPLDISDLYIKPENGEYVVYASLLNSGLDLENTGGFMLGSAEVKF